MTSESPTLSTDLVVSEPQPETISEPKILAVSEPKSTPSPPSTSQIPSPAPSAPAQPKPQKAAQNSKQHVSPVTKLKDHSRSLVIMLFALALSLLMPQLAIDRSGLNKAPPSHFLAHTPVLMVAVFTELSVYSFSFMRQMMSKVIHLQYSHTNHRF